MSDSTSFFAGKTAVITGAGGTLCSVIALRLAQEGAKLALLGRTLAPLEAVAERIHAAGGTALPIACDVTRPDHVERARETVLRKLGCPWFLLNGAGGNQAAAITSTTEFTPAELAADRTPELRGFFNLDPAVFEDVIRINTLGTMVPSQIFGREMAALGRGSILNFASMTSFRPITRVAAYATAKAGIVNFTAWLAAYLAPSHIRVNGVAPGFYVNDRSRKILQNPDGSLSARGRNVMNHTPNKRFGEAKDLLGGVLWLLDDDKAEFVTGVTLPIDGGFLCCPGV
ncbi:MAG: SDR family NAD(P)-dependent oxidoreductase [Opitutaceae bacterium]|nr:SDR family NAD(P)-dependent oxidoreductase [Opitutaceae bacterium]